MPIHGYPGNVITANPTAPTVSSASGVWTTEQQLINQSAGRWPMAATQISRSLRFNSADSAYLNRTPASAGNRKTFTWSGWVKKSALGSLGYLFSVPDSTGHASLRFTTSDTLEWAAFTAANGAATTNAVFRDASAWYHIVFAMDTTQATTTNRIKLYVNNVLQTFSSYTAPTQNQDTPVNNTVEHDIGKRVNVSEYLSSYLTEINFIDGLALDPSYFGFNNSDTGVWSPKQYTGTYGTNGFYLNFSDNSGTTSTTLGKDYSGNGNNWTPNNFSVTAGAGNDSLVDSPTSYGTDTGAGGEVRGNYATFNPLDKSSNITTSNGNLDFAGSGNSFSRIRASVAMTTGKWYAEFVINAESAPSRTQGGIMGQSSGLTNYLGTDAKSWSMYESSTNILKVNNNSTSTLASSNSLDPGDVQMFAYDADAGKLWFGKNGSWFASGNPASGTNETFSSVSGESMFFASSAYNTSDTGTWNFGQRAFAYTAPSGFKALCTQNLPTPTIGATSTTQANKYFDVTTFIGNASTNTIVNSGSMQPDMVWLKSRSNANNHTLYDAVRGVNIQLYPNLTNAEDSGADLLTSFNSNGFTLGASQNSNDNNGESSVGWQWRASNTTAVTNTAGTITSTVSANTTSGFSIATYTGTGSAATIGHGLGAVPRMIIVKNRDAADAWQVYHAANTANPETDYLVLNTDAATADNANRWNDTLPTSTVFSIGDGVEVNTNTEDYVAYVFAAIPGYSAFGSYTGNGSTDGPFVYTGFRPRFLLLKISSTTGNWAIYDTSRNTYNVMDLYLYPNSSAAEGGSGTPRVDALSNGFKLRNSGQDNTSSATYIYACFAENPFKYSLAR